MPGIPALGILRQKHCKFKSYLCYILGSWPALCTETLEWIKIKNRKRLGNKVFFTKQTKTNKKNRVSLVCQSSWSNPGPCYRQALWHGTVSYPPLHEALIHAKQVESKHKKLKTWWWLATSSHSVLDSLMSECLGDEEP